MTFLNKLVFKRKLGEGNFGVVSLYEDKKTGDKYAVKEFFPKKFKKNEFFSTPESEKENFNLFIKKMGLSSHKAIVENEKLILPFFTGKEPSLEEIQKTLVDIYKNGFVMADPSKSNFMHTPKHGLIPIDYGAVFNIEDEKFMNDALARNFVTNAVVTYEKVFRGPADRLVQEYLFLKKNTPYGYYLDRDDSEDDKSGYELSLPDWVQNLGNTTSEQISDNAPKSQLSKTVSTFWASPKEKKVPKNNVPEKNTGTTLFQL